MGKDNKILIAHARFRLYLERGLRLDPKCQEFVHVVQSKFISPKRKSLSVRVGIKCAFLAPNARKCLKLEVKESMTTKFIAKPVMAETLDQKDTDMVVALVL